MAELPADAHIGEVHLTVADLDRSVAFYTETLGFRLLQRDGQGAVLGAADDRPLMRLQGRPGAPAKPRRSSGLYHVAILTPSRAALGRSPFGHAGFARPTHASNAGRSKSARLTIDSTARANR